MAPDEENPSSGFSTATSDDADEQAIEDLRAEFESFKAEVQERTVNRTDLEADLKRYVRWRVRKGHARGWGPYLVLLYGTAMTIGAFYFLQGVWAVLSMIVIWLSTLGLYALMLIVGSVISVIEVPGRLIELFREKR